MKLAIRLYRSLALIATTAGALMLNTSIAHADDTSTGSFGIGVHGGVNINNLDVTRSGSATINAAKENVNGALLGVHLELGTPMFVLRPELNYSVHGYQYVGFIDVSRKYLEIPVLFKFSILPGPIQPFFEIGPQLGIHMSDTVTALGGSVTTNDTSNSTDIAGVAGAGIKLAIIPSIAIEAEARYVFGFTNSNADANVEVKTRALQVLAGLTFSY